MRCPACHQNIRVQGKFCPKCGDQIFGLPVHGSGGPEGPSEPSVPPPPAQDSAIPVPPPPPPTAYAPTSPPPPGSVAIDDDFSTSLYPSPPASEPVLDITLEDDTPGATSLAEAIGKVCPYCRFPIKAGEPVQICPSCGEPHHRDCWQENGGCTIYGCRSSPAMAGTAAAPVAVPSQTLPQWPGYGDGGYQSTSLPRDAIALLEAELTRLATNALAFALLGFLGLTAVIGLLTGVSVLGQISHSGLRASRARGLAWAAVGLSVFWLIIIIGLLVVGAQIISSVG